MGVYSPDMLLHFPEQLRPFLYFNATADINSSYTPVGSPVTVWGIIQNAASSIKENHDNLSTSDHMNVWIDTKLNIGWFLSFQSTMYRIIPGNEWNFEGGFYSYTIERVMGDNGTPVAQTWNKGGTLV